jgi:hypothetical protein
MPSTYKTKIREMNIENNDKVICLVVEPPFKALVTGFILFAGGSLDTLDKQLYETVL